MENKKTTGLKKRLGKGYAKFGREGSIWRWEFTWNNPKRHKEGYGYDKGFLDSNYGIFERLKRRFIQGVLINARYFEKANNFRLYLCGPTKEEDILVFTLFIHRDFELEYEFTPWVYNSLNHSSIDYLEELLIEAQVKIRNLLSSKPLNYSEALNSEALVKTKPLGLFKKLLLEELKGEKVRDYIAVKETEESVEIKVRARDEEQLNKAVSILDPFVIVTARKIPSFKKKVFYTLNA
ncbi:MAG: hypothetical protein KatS3mg101_1176 [Patescibacteria group bacterium]|nr:MAG: hypothetical protein KatS3mg101_1176 [Patescibacteria group bacterium]